MMIRKELNDYKTTEMDVHEDSKQFTRLHEFELLAIMQLSTIGHRDGPVDEVMKRSIGKRVRVKEYCDGYLRYYGPHKVWDDL